MEQINPQVGLERIRKKFGPATRKPLTTVPGQTRIFVKKDVSGQEYLVPSWISKKGNLCWKIGETVYVKLRNGFTMMLVDPKNNEWVPTDAHTKAKAPASQKEPTEPERARIQPFRGAFSEA